MLKLIQAALMMYTALFPIVKPVGTSILFLSLVRGSSSQKIHQLSFKIACYSTIMLLFVLLSGSLILKFFGITIPILLVSGGLLLFYVGWVALNTSDVPLLKDVNTENLDMNSEQKAFYPLTMPVTIGPCCISIVIALGAHGQISTETLFIDQLGFGLGIVLMGTTIYLCYRFSESIFQKLRPSMMQVIMRLVAFLNVCIGLEIIWHGLSALMVSKVGI